MVDHAEAFHLANARVTSVSGGTIWFCGVDTTADLVAALTLALRYLEHPEVQAIPFALPTSTVATKIKTLLARTET